MKIWVLRHGEAQANARSDAERELTGHGRSQVLSSAAHLLGKPLDRIIASPYVRAQQTAELVRQALGFSEPISTVSWLIPESDPKKVLKQLDLYTGEEILLVSHQPLVGVLIGLLVQGSYPDIIEASYRSIFNAETTLLFPRSLQPRDMRACMELLSQGKLKLRDLISDVRTPDAAPRTYKELAENKTRLLTVAFKWK